MTRAKHPPNTAPCAVAAPERAPLYGAPDEPELIAMLGLVDEFKRVHETMDDRAFAFILGAGASRTSGIKTASQMVTEWIDILRRRAVGTTEPPETWATAERLKIDAFSPNNPAAAYPALYQRMYSDDPGSGYAFLEAQMLDAEPSYGYSVLGRLLATQRHRVVITTNFDNLVADSLSIFSTTYPLVCGHEALAPFARSRPRRPLVVKVHHDLLFGPKSMPEELDSLPDGYSRTLADLLGHYTPIVIGYGGNDGSLMGFLERLPERAIPGGVYWCYWEGDGLPTENIRKFVSRQRGKLVPIPGFDELMTLLGETLSFDVPDKFVLDRAKDRAVRIVRQAQQLKEKLKSGKATEPATTTSVAAGSNEGTAESRPPAAHDPELSAVLRALQRTMGRHEGPKRWWQWQELINQEKDLTGKRVLYDASLEALPGSVELLGNYASFLHIKCRDIDGAEIMYKRAMEIDPQVATNLGNYANLLCDERQDLGASEAMYKQALIIEPTNTNILCNYAIFLKTDRNDRESAEKLYKHAMEGNPTEKEALTNFAYLSLSLEHAEEGLRLIEKALLLCSDDAPSETDAECWMYAYCCRRRAKQPVALKHLRKLIAIDTIQTYRNFSMVLAHAKIHKHSEARWLTKLARVLAQDAPAETLKAWPAWRSAV